jgi:hypothetical protein
MGWDSASLGKCRFLPFEKTKKDKQNMQKAWIKQFAGRAFPVVRAWAWGELDVMVMHHLQNISF